MLTQYFPHVQRILPDVRLYLLSCSVPAVRHITSAVKQPYVHHSHISPRSPFVTLSLCHFCVSDDTKVRTFFCYPNFLQSFFAFF